jgi:deoxyribonuclease V
MHIHSPHSWDLAPREAIALQKEMAGQVDAHTPLVKCELAAGADVSYNRFSPVVYAAVVVVRLADGAVVETSTAVGKASFPYIPGLLTFREGPIVLEALARIQCRPDVVMFDGHGLAHPRRFGLACHMGFWLDVPTLGCAKSRLIGTAREPGQKPGSLAPLRDQGQVIGNLVRTRRGVKPVFVSVGHRIDLPSAVRVVLQATRGYRLPEPTRQAHLSVNALRCQVLR